MGTGDDSIVDMFKRSQVEETLSEEELKAAVEEESEDEELEVEHEGPEESAAEEPVAEEEKTSDELYNELLDKYNRQSQELLDARSGRQVVASTKSVEQPVVHVEAAKPIEKLKINKELLQKALTEDDGDVMEEIVNSIQDHILSNMPNVANFQATLEDRLVQKAIREMNVQRTVGEFYTDNADLQKYVPVVSLIAEEIATKNPDKNLSEILKLTEAEARRQLRLRKTTSSSAGRNQRPAFAKGSTTRKGKSAEKSSGLLGEIGEMKSLKW